MSARPCNTNLCVCPAVDSPVTNTSAESPDPLLFWGEIWNPYNPWKNPPLGNGQYTKQDCSTDIQEYFTNIDPIIYANTQLLASLQALAADLGCEWPQTGDLTYTNDEQTATVYCPDGTEFTYTVAAGTITASFSDAELGEAFHVYANAWASAYAYQQASAMMDCITPDPDIPPEPGPRRPNFPSGPGFTNNPSWMCLGGEYVDNYTISGRSNGSYIIEIVGGSIPPGTAFVQTSPTTASISGFPVAAGEYTWTIRATSLTAPTVTLQVKDSLWVMGITNDVLPDGSTGTAYSEQLLATGGTSPYTFAIDAGSTLPDGLTLTSDGTISGTPTTAGDYSFDVVLTDANGGECTQTVSISVSSLCPDWENDLVWPVAGGGTTGAGTRSFTPSGVTGGDNFVASVSATTIPPDGASAFNFGGGIWGYLPYSGPACNCNLHLIFSKVGSVAGQITIVEEKTSLAVLSVPFNTTANGTYDFPFSVPDSAGTPYHIRVEITLQVTGGSGPKSISVDGTFSNV